MSEPPARFSLRKWIWDSWHTDTREWILGGIGTVVLIVLAKLRDEVWNLLVDAIQQHPGETLLLGALGTTIFAVGKWHLWKRLAKLEAERASKVDGLEASLTAEKSKCAALEQKFTKLNAESLPDAELKLIFSCIFSYGEATPSEIGGAIKMDPHRVAQLMVPLQHRHQFVRRVSTKENGEEVFTATEKGRAYASDQGIESIEQSHEAYKQTAAEKEAVTYKNAFLEVAAREAELRKENELLRAQLAMPALQPIPASHRSQH